MYKTVPKKVFLFFSFSIAALTAKAQADFNYKKFAIGTGISYIHGYTSLNKQDNHFAENVSFNYYYTPYIPLAIELQKGTLSGGGLTVNLDPYGRQYTNNYLAVIVHGDFQLGQIIDSQGDASLDILKGFYAGTGIGLISDNDKVQRTNVILANGPLTYVFPGVDQSINVMVPMRVGYEYKITNSFDEPFIRVIISYEHNLVFGQGLDGYGDPSSHFKHNFLNQYRQISFGIRFDFGETSIN
jgi:hypothetical protein